MYLLVYDIIFATLLKVQMLLQLTYVNVKLEKEIIVKLSLDKIDTQSSVCMSTLFVAFFILYVEPDSPIIVFFFSFSMILISIQIA